MRFNRLLVQAYRLASILIVSGFLMLCQPVVQERFAWGFPVLLTGVILFMVLDHIPEKTVNTEEA